MPLASPTFEWKCCDDLESTLRILPIIMGIQLTRGFVVSLHLCVVYGETRATYQSWVWCQKLKATEASKWRPQQTSTMLFADDDFLIMIFETLSEQIKVEICYKKLFALCCIRTYTKVIWPCLRYFAQEAFILIEPLCWAKYLALK